MGLLRTLRNAILGPLFFWLLILAYMIGWHFYQDPPALSIQDFPSDTPKDVKEALIKIRRPLIKEVMAVYQVRLIFKLQSFVF